MCSCIIRLQITEQRALPSAMTKCALHSQQHGHVQPHITKYTGLWQASSKGSKAICHMANKASSYILHQSLWLQSSAALLVRILFEVKLQFRLPYSLGYWHLHGDSHEKLLDVGSLKSTSLNKNCTMLMGVRLSSC